MRVLVTGSNGFIGKHLTSDLAQAGAEVLGIDLAAHVASSGGAEYACCDIRNKERLENIVADFGPHCLIHLAARIDLDGGDLRSYDSNIMGVENLVEVVRRSRSVRRCIFTSSQLVCQMGYVPQSDEDYKPSTFYGESKVLGEKIVRQNDGGGVEWCITRPTTIWGPGMSAHYLRLFRAIQKGYYFHVGNKSQYKSYGYVGNTSYQYVQLINAEPVKIHRKTFYLADYEPVSLRDWTDSFQKQLGARPIWTMPKSLSVVLAGFGDLLNYAGLSSFPFNSFRLRNILTGYQFDLSTTSEVCGSLPYSTEEGVRRTVEWLREHR
jgi:nucleoside-diphosphate-sugar epimerase